MVSIMIEIYVYIQCPNYDIPKFVMFSAHDSTCAAFMGFMKEVFDTESRYPYFATNINLELYQNGRDYYIEYIINDESIKKISYSEFKSTLKKRMKTMDEVNEFCGFKKEEKPEDDGDNKNDKIYLWVNVGLGVVSLVLIIIIIVTAMKKKKGLDSVDIEGRLTED